MTLRGHSNKWQETSLWVFLPLSAPLVLFSVWGWTLVFPALPSLSPCTFPQVNYISCHGNRDVIGTGGLNDIQKHSLQRGLKCIPWLTALGCVVCVEGGYVGMWRLYLGHHLGTRVGSVREGAGLGGRWLLVGFPESQTMGGLYPWSMSWALWMS